jgi:hypothetical protein
LNQTGPVEVPPRNEFDNFAHLLSKAEIRRKYSANDRVSNGAMTATTDNSRTAVDAGSNTTCQRRESNTMHPLGLTGAAATAMHNLCQIHS